MRNSTFKKLSQVDYMNAYKDLESYCIQNTNLLLYGEFGNASFPSISDLDVFICLEDSNFVEDRNNIIAFIDSNDTRKYLFFHDPLILAETVLPYLRLFHTCYNLEISFNKDSKLIPPVNVDDLKLLNVIWTTFLIGIGPEIIINGKYGVRDKLLVLKNICQSIVNIDADSEALHFSEIIRRQAFRNELSIEEVNEIFEIMLRELYSVSHKLKFDESEINISRNKIKVEKNKTFIHSDRNNFTILNKKVIIELDNQLYSFFTQFYNRKSNSIQIQKYIDNTLILNLNCKKKRFVYPFITPFGFHFFRDDLKFKIKKKLFNFLECLS